MAGDPNKNEAAEGGEQKLGPTGLPPVLSNNAKIGAEPGNAANVESLQDREDKTAPLPGQTGGNAEAGAAAPVMPDLSNPDRVGDGVVGNNDPSEQAVREGRVGPKADAADLAAANKTAPGNDTLASAQGEGLAKGTENEGLARGDFNDGLGETEEEQNRRLNTPKDSQYAEDDGAGNIVEHKVGGDPEEELKPMRGENEADFNRRVGAAKRQIMRQPIARTGRLG